MDIPSYQTQRYTADEHEDESEEEERISLEHGCGLGREAEPLEGVGPREALSHPAYVSVGEVCEFSVGFGEAVSGVDR